MQRLALFDLDDTLVDRRRAFRAWAEEFVTARELDDSALRVAETADRRRRLRNWPRRPPDRLTIQRRATARQTRASCL